MSCCTVAPLIQGFFSTPRHSRASAPAPHKGPRITIHDENGGVSVLDGTDEGGADDFGAKGLAKLVVGKGADLEGKGMMYFIPSTNLHSARCPCMPLGPVAPQVCLIAC